MTHHPECEDATGAYSGSCTCAIIKRREAMTEITQADRDAAAQYDVVEAFARHRQYGYDQGYYDGRQADKALKIPREPTQAMLKAGDLAWSKGTLILAIWQAMYDAALQETGQ